jgi:parallel beta-helix repeat protein
VRWGTRAGASAVTAAALLALVAWFAPAAAGNGKRKIEVRPGPNAIAKALDRAGDGQVLRIHKGRYEEALTIDKRVKLVGVGKRRPVIDAGCAAPTTIRVAADRVSLRRLNVVGADTGDEVAFSEVSGGRATDVVVRDTCDALYGINVYDTGPIAIRRSRALGFDDAGFYIGEITSTGGGSIRLSESQSHRNHRGLIVENSSGGEIRVIRNQFHGNNVPVGFFPPTGVLITNSDGVAVEANSISDNGIFGLLLGADSDGNVIDDNVFFGNPLDIEDQGSGNCGSGNQFATGDALPPC